MFRNLFENAVEHAESDASRIEVDVETTPETATVTVADNGPGISADTRATLFERKSQHHGLGLYLSRILANRYGGRIELVETGPDGSVFAVTLQRATPEGESGDGAAGREETGTERDTVRNTDTDSGTTIR
ncbi:sensor histidine kinase [Natronorubrum halalkaliphilum]|uniref:sensor histidine kinase n=1 Tax=Natronorubrum halalkaliphilum TaxID=2691917 RepID=UPI002E28B87B|nr:sensor histidine kinase [Natronorubrum halalkaliphilum]